MFYIKALFLSVLVFSFLVEILSPEREVKINKSIEINQDEQIIDDELSNIGNRYNVENPNKISDENINSDIWLPKIVDILKNSDYGFIFFYFLIFSTLFLQIFYYFSNSEISYLAVDFNLQAPPMLGVGGTIYALVNSDISGSTSIIETLTAILLGAGLTTLLGIFVFVINHFLSRYIKTV